MLADIGIVKILIIVGAIISMVASSRKKMKEKDRVHRPTINKNPAAEDDEMIIRELRRRFDFEQEEQQEVEQLEHFFEEGSNSFGEGINSFGEGSNSFGEGFESFGEGVASTVHDDSPFNETISSTESHNTPIEIDPAKLVIYSEIMKPKWDEY